MDLVDGPAALGGIIMSVALGAWALGRWQRGFAPAQDGGTAQPVRAGTAGPRETPAPVAPMPAELSPRTPTAEPRSVSDHPASLGELHAEISAYRRAQQVLATLEGDPLQVTLVKQGGQADCRYLGLIGEPTCAMPDGARPASGCGSSCAGYAPRLAVQLSASARDFTRV